MVDEVYLWLLLAGAIAGTYIWRAVGVAFSSRINTEGPVFKWVTCVSYAMLSGLIARMVLLPVGPLAEVPLFTRVAGMVVGLIVFFLVKRQVLPAVGAGLVVFIALVAFRYQ